MPPRVSVIIPTFNRRSMVCEAITSVLDQDISNLELIVVDDGSMDGTAKLIRSRFPQVRLLSQTQRTGRSSARNAGLQLARAPYVAFLDSDDRFEPWHVRQLTSGLDPAGSANGSVRFGVAAHWDPQTGVVAAIEPPPYLPQDQRLACLVGMWVTMPAMVVPRSRAMEVGGFPDGLEGSEDWVFLVRLSRTCPFVRVGGVPSVRIRVHEGRSMADVAWDLEWRKAALELLRSELDLTDEERRLLLAGHHRYRAARLYELGEMSAARGELRRASRQLNPVQAVRWNGRLMLQSLLRPRSRTFLKDMRRRLAR